MSAVQNEEVLESPDELTALKARADLLGLSYHPSIGVEKLRDKVAAAMADEEVIAPVVVAKAPEVESENARRIRRKREATELIRIRVTCMNPNKKEWDGEIFTSGNSAIGTHKKYVPFDADEGWHVPRIIYNQIVERMCQVFVTKVGPRGNKIRVGKLVREFNVEVMPSLTATELTELARRQAMSKAID